MYTEMHARSAFSFLEGASVPEEMAAACARLGMSAMAVLDRDGAYGAPRFYLAAKKSSVKAHIGAEVTSALGWRYPLLVNSRVGYQNLCRLITRMKLRARKGEGHVEREEIAELREGLICLTGGEGGRLLCRNSERHLKSPAEMERLFADLPEAIANTQELSSRLEFTLNDLGYEFPKYPVPKGSSQMQFLRERTHEGMLARYGCENEKARKQIDRELALIEKLDLPGYFLIVWDIVRFCREKNILVQGRGSAANSAVCYAMGITAGGSVGMGVLFGRFFS